MKQLLKLFIILLALFSSGKIVAQTSKEVVSLDLPKIHCSSQLPFSKIILVDKRMDSSKLGYIARADVSYKKLVIENGTREIVRVLNRSLQKSFSSVDSQFVMVVIKKLWILDGVEPPTQVKPKYRAEQPITGIAFTLEVYLQEKGLYNPLFRMDSVITSKTSFGYYQVNKEGGDLVMAAFQACVNKLEAVDYSNLSNRRFSLKDIDENDKRILSLPILTSATRTKGIYLTFSDFKKNKVVEKDFTIVSDDISDEFYLLQNGVRTSFDKFWGYSDGKDLFAKQDHRIFQLKPEGNTFEYFKRISQTNQFGPTRLYEVSPAGIAAAGVSALLGMIPTTHVTQRPYQLDMDTGKFY